MTPEQLKSCGTLIFRQSRMKMVLVCGVGFVFVALGIWFILTPEQAASSRYPRDIIEVMGWLATFFFGATTVAGFISLVRPTTVRLEPAGLMIQTVWRGYTRPWSAVSNFRIWRYRSARLIVFDDVSPSAPVVGRLNAYIAGATSSLPAMLDEELDRILQELKSAKERWG